MNIKDYKNDIMPHMSKMNEMPKRPKKYHVYLIKNDNDQVEWYFVNSAGDIYPIGEIPFAAFHKSK